MKIRIKAKCHDKVTGKQYKPGDVLEVSKKRGAEMCAVSGGMYAEVVEDQEPEKVPAEEPVEPLTDTEEAPQKKPAKKKSTKKAKSE